MRITEEMRTKIRGEVVAYLQERGSASRAELMDGVTARLGMTEKDRADTRPAGKYQTVRSYVGASVDSLLAEESLRLFEHRYTLTRDGLVVVREDECEKAIREILKTKRHTKPELFALLDSRFGADKTQTRRDDAMLHSCAGSVLARLAKAGEISNDGRGYTLVSRKKAYSSRPMEAGAFKSVFLARLHREGGPFFERFLCNLLEKYFTVTGRTVTVCEVTGGSADGGVDVVVDTVDGLGFAEHILVQAKCRGRAHVTEKEVREFYGAMTAQEGSRGIYATTSVFHEGAQRFLDSLDNCVGIDGDKLFELVERTSYGIVKTRGGYRFDEGIFTK